MDFEFDPRKSESNHRKHGVDFVEAQVLWDDPDRLQLSARTQGEARFMMIGKIGIEHWSAIFTLRENKTRIVSVRRARKDEVDAYEN